MKIIFGLLGLIISNAAYAECVPHRCNDVKVERLYTNTNGVVYVGTSGDETKLDCNPISNVYLSFNLSDPAGDAYYSTLLASQISERNVSIRINNGSEGCEIQYIVHDK